MKNGDGASPTCPSVASGSGQGRYYVIIWEQGKPSIIGYNLQGVNGRHTEVEGWPKPLGRISPPDGQTITLTHEERQQGEQAITLLHGDTVEKLKGIPDKIADVALFDPPYPCIERPYGTINEEEWHALMESVLRESHRILKPTGSVMVVIQPNYEKLGRMRLWPWSSVLGCRHVERLGAY